ncbi:MAG: hypothetical protein Q9216_004152 [Gyalolechia sp. 2 TL-2023]
MSISPPKLKPRSSSLIPVVPPTPPSTETSSPRHDLSRKPPQPKDMMYVTQCLSSGSEHHTRRFSFENPTWPNDEEYLLDISSLPFCKQDDDATIVGDSMRTISRGSQNTLCGSISFNHESYPSPFELSQCLYYKDLPPTPPCDYLESSPSFGHCPMQPKDFSLAESYVSGPHGQQKPSTTQKVSPDIPSPVKGARVRSWPVIVAQRKAPPPPVVEEKSAWSDSGSEDEEEEDQIARFKRRVSTPLRSFLCRGKEPWRKSA